MGFPPPQGQGALVGRLRSFSMQDLRALPDDAPIHYRDALYPDPEELHRRPIGFSTTSQVDSDSLDERWSDSEVTDTRGTAKSRGTLPPKPLQRSQSLRVSKKKTLIREASTKTAKSRSKKRLVQSESEN
ncbi:hypothetical protein FKM82_030733 [Ascaphus truei]